jgi:hypothetical protein
VPVEGNSAIDPEERVVAVGVVVVKEKVLL